jgi:hypothetical protein
MVNVMRLTNESEDKLDRLASRQIYRAPVEQAPAAQALAINVVFTTTRATLVALRRAGELARELGAKIRVIAPHVVPYPLPLNRPAVDPAYIEQHFRTLAGDKKIDTRVDIRLCRDADESVRQALPPHSLVVIGGRKRLWPWTRETHLARALSRAGHHVIFMNEKGESCGLT